MKVIGCSARAGPGNKGHLNTHCDDCGIADDHYECAYSRADRNAILIFERK